MPLEGKRRCIRERDALVGAVEQRAMGDVLLYTLILYTMNFLVDLSYAYLDPRVELE